MPAIALLDRDGVYGAARLARAATNAGIQPIVGSELTLADGSRLPLLMEDREGYQNLCRLITRMKLGAPKGAAALTLADLEPNTAGLVCLTGGGGGAAAPGVAGGDPDRAPRRAQKRGGAGAAPPLPPEISRLRFPGFPLPPRPAPARIPARAARPGGARALGRGHPPGARTPSDRARARAHRPARPRGLFP